MIPLASYEGAGRDQWLKDRATGIGASESSALFGLHPYHSAYSLYCLKRGLLDEPPDIAEWVELGIELQPVIARLYERRTGRAVVQLDPHFLYRSESHACMVATPDGLIDHADGFDGPGTVEIKNVTEWKADEWQDDDPPLKFQIQATHQMIVTGCKWAAIVGLIGGNRLVYRDLRLNEKFARVLIERCHDFWDRVQRGDAPEVDAHPATREALKRLHPSDNGAEVALPAEAAEWDAQIRQAKDEIKRLQKIVDENENRMRQAIGDATYGVLLGEGVRYSLKTTERAGFIVDPTTYRTLKRSEKK